tara:strand:+ start:3314 stop:4042 length:729 start_codon:yes stop_codon:yes gene_type:complete
MSTTINKDEIQKFSKLAEEWWDVNGKFKPLHMFNPVRIEYITEKIKEHFKIKNNNSNYLQGLKILDIGCGGGLMSEPMSRLGASVTGIDASEKNINVAKIHSEENGLKIKYNCTSPENLKNSEKYDVILNLEVVEHVDNIELYIESCEKLLAANGLMFTATLNRSLTSYIKAIIGAEYILRWLPIGTHDWNKFIKPEELVNYLSKVKLKTADIKGLNFNPLTNKWKRSNDLSVNYIVCSLKD